AKRIVKKLNKIGFNISIDDVLEGAKNSAIGRPHIAEALLNRGFIKNYFEAFYKYIGDFKPAYERKIHISIQSAIKLINDAGGLSFVAHPCNMQDTLLMNLIKCGIDGIEAIHPSHNKHHIRYYSGIVNQYCLLDSGGSDFHGGRREDDDNFGKFKVPVAKVENIKKMLVTNGY
ncbi:MAG: PHP domain-containing protein, partial [Melioribacteraceae bacterium]|nr:PHP domain-containing protein [Melioribacteraceae bacterium]